jgi:4'-phosphopantetheinyl transferase
MTVPGWLSRCLAEVPPGEDWLGPAERRVLAGLRLEWRRSDWRLGRWTAKLAASIWLTVPLERVQILAAVDGAPEVWLDGQRAPVSLSLSHRAGRSLAAIASEPTVVGCDLELVEPRSSAFVNEWLTPPEQRLLASCEGRERAWLANLAWTAKEAGAKVRREGLRLDLRHAVVTPVLAADRAGAWHELCVNWRDDREATAGWWRSHSGCVMAIAAEPSCGRPRKLA